MKSKRIVQTLCICVFCIVLSVLARTKETPEKIWNAQSNAAYKEKSDEKMPDVEEPVRIIEASEGETDDFFHRADGTMIYYFYVENDSYTYFLPESLVDYCIEAVKADCLIERLAEISAEYEVIGAEEKELFHTESDTEIGLASFSNYFQEDHWYRVSLSPEGDDIVVEHTDEDGYIVNYFFWNINKSYKYSDVPVRSGGQKQSEPYFIQWEDMNYMAIPYWNIEKDEIAEVAVYQFINNFGGGVMGIGINSDGTINIAEQQYCAVTNWQEDVPDVARVWPEVIKE